MAKHTVRVVGTITIAKEFEVDDDGLDLAEIVDDIIYVFAQDCAVESFLGGPCEQMGIEYSHAWQLSEKITTITYKPIFN